MLTIEIWLRKLRCGAEQHNREGRAQERRAPLIVNVRRQIASPKTQTKRWSPIEICMHSVLDRPDSIPANRQRV